VAATLRVVGVKVRLTLGSPNFPITQLKSKLLVFLGTPFGIKARDLMEPLRIIRILIVEDEFLIACQSPGSVVAAIDHDGSGILCRDVGGCSGSPWQARIFSTDQGSQFTGAAFTDVRMARAHSVTMSSSSGSGAASNTRRSIPEH
jgi:hypothetical protein